MSLSIHSSNPSTPYKNFFLIDLCNDQFQQKLCQNKESIPKQTYQLIVVLDCSGSMSGSRIRLATGILKDLLDNPMVDSITIIKFGTSVQEPQVFTKKNSEQILSIQADCGGTDFVPAIKKLMEVIDSPGGYKPWLLSKISSLFGSKTKTDTRGRLISLFFSDGEASTPNNLYKPLQNMLQKYDCPLLSVAVTTNAQPELMINLSQLYGDLELVLLQQNDLKENGLALIEEKLCLGLQLYEAKMKMKIKNETITGEFRFREHQEKAFMSFLSKNSFGDVQDEFQVNIEGKGDLNVSVKAKGISLIGSTDEKLSNLREILGFLMKDSISKVVKKTLSKEDGLELVRGLRTIMMSCSVKNNYFKEIEVLRQDKSNPQRLQEILKRQKELKTNTLELQTTINKLEDLIGGGDLRAALETYSAKTMSNKVNRRAMHLAQKNAEKNLPSSIKDWVINIIMDSAPDQEEKEVPECILWCINQLQTGVDEWKNTSKTPELDISGLDWVGRGCLVNPGKTACLNAWGLNSVEIRPVDISNGSVSYVKVSETDNGRRLASIKGMNLGEFNCSVPFLHPDNNVTIQRIAMVMIKGTHEGTRAFSNLFCGSPDLFSIEQVFAFYSVASVNTLMKADKTVHFEDSARAILSLWDLAFYSQKDKNKNDFCVLGGANAADDFVKENIERLVQNPTEFIARKDDTNMPGFLRLFYLLMVGDRHLKNALKETTFEEFISKLKFSLITRALLDMTASRYFLKDFVGFNEDEYRKEVMEKIEQDLEVNELVGKFKFDIKLKLINLQKMLTGIRTLLVLSKFKEEKKCDSFRELHCKILKKEVSFDEFIENLKKTKEANPEKGNIVKQFLEFTPETLSSLKLVEHPRISMDSELSFKKLMSRLIIVCIQKHTVKGNYPRHDSNHNQKIMEKFKSWNDLCGEEFNKILLGLMKTVESQAIGELGDAQKKLRKIKSLIKKIEEFQNICVHERLCYPYRETQLSYSGDKVPTFSKKRKMFDYLRLSAYGVEALEELRELNLGNVANFCLKTMLEKKSQYLHGVSLYSDNNMKKSSSAEEFTNLMMKDLETHYQQKNAENKSVYTFGTIKKNHLKSVCEHLFLENQIYTEMKSISSNDENEIFDEIVKKIPDCLTRNGYNKTIRTQHLKWLIKSKMQNTFPFE
jgi:hypothetical protein